MMRAFSRIPIFRRLFLAFFLAAIIPDSILAGMYVVYTKVAHGIRTDQLGPFTVGTLLAILISTGIVVVLGWVVNSTITQPLHQLATLATQIRQGNTKARAITIGNDEIALVSQSINSMLDTIVRLMQQAEAQRDYLQAQIEKLIGEVSGVGEGNLNIQAEVTTETLGILADAFNYMVEELSTLVIQVKNSSLEVNGATITTQHQMSLIVAAAERQLHQIVFATKTIATMADMSLKVSQRTEVLADAARDARGAAQNGRETVQQALAGFVQITTHVQHVARHIDALKERSRIIDEVVKAVDSLAHKITRLALDASIQVAMAEKTEKKQIIGFGPVASALRLLSEETKGQVQTIVQEMQEVRNDIETVVLSVQEAKRETVLGTERIQHTGNDLTAIFELVEQQALHIESIHQEIAALFRASQEIQQTITDISHETQQKSENIRLVAHKVQQIAALTQHLRASVDVFKLKEQSQESMQQKSLAALIRR